MSQLLLYRRTNRILLAILLVDLPVLAAAAIAGAVVGYDRVWYWIGDWRMQHPWSLIPTAALVLIIVVRMERRR